RQGRERKLILDQISIDATMYDKDRELARFGNLQFKVVRFAMDKIRENTVYSLKDGFIPKGDDCNCFDRVNYNIPCPCIIHAHPGALPLSIIDQRWLIQPNDEENI
ncbi:hypothetical protein ABG067_008758, partial [Albugo candida]